MSNKDGAEVCKSIQLRFTDISRFMASSLDKLASNLDDDQCKQLRTFYKEDEVLGLGGARAYTHTSIWMDGKNLRRQVYNQKMRFRVGLI